MLTSLTLVALVLIALCGAWITAHDRREIGKRQHRRKSDRST